MGRPWSPPPRKIALFRALKLGDMLCAVPFLRAVRAHFPAAEIVLIGLPWARELVDRYPLYIDDFREFPGYPGLPEREPLVERLPRFFERIRSEEFDLAVQLHGSGAISNAVTMQFGARVNAGFFEFENLCPDPSTFLLYPNQGLELRRLLKLAEHLGIAPRGESLEFPIWSEDRIRARRLVGSFGQLSRGLVCIHGGASAPERRWPLDRFVAVADALSDRGYAIVLTGSASEAGLTGAIARAMRADVLDLAGATSLGTLAALLEQSRLVVCNDTGISHLADALGVPSVVISTGNNPERWAPIDGLRHRVLCRVPTVDAATVLTEANDLLNHSLDLPARELQPSTVDKAANVQPSARRPWEPCDPCAF